MQILFKMPRPPDLPPAGAQKRGRGGEGGRGGEVGGGMRGIIMGKNHPAAQPHLSWSWVCPKSAR